MTAGDSLSEGVRTLYNAAGQQMPTAGVGVVRQDGPEHVLFTYLDAFGLTAYRARSADVVEAFRPRAAGVRSVTATELDADANRLVGSRLRQSAFAEEIRLRCRAGHACTVPVPNAERSALLVFGLVENGEPTAAQTSALESLASRAVDLLQPLPATSEIDVLRRLDAVERLLPAFFRVLDVRDIFDQLSAVTKDVLRHDFAALGLLSDDLKAIDLYVQTSPGSSYPSGGAMPYPVVETASLLYRFVDDVTVHPLEHNQATAKAGGRASVRVSIRMDDKVLGILNFTSRDSTPYSSTDLVVARRIADYVGLAISHYRLAEESRRAAALRERAANLQMLDGLLNTLTGVLDVRQVFDRVSAIAASVLPHDALSIAEVIDEGKGVRIHASHGLGDLPQPMDIPTPDMTMVTEQWDYRLIDDLQKLPEYAPGPGVAAGMRSTIFVPIRLEGRLFGGLNFYSKTVGRYVQDDVLVARRITDHVALAVSHRRLAEEARRNEELRARTTNLELLDELLATLVDSRDLPEAFGHISDIARKVLSHEAAVLMVRLPDGVHARVYASSGFPIQLPDVTEVPEELLANPDWEYDIFDDLARYGPRYAQGIKIGLKSLLRVPIRLDGKFAGALVFFSKEYGTFKPSDVLVARRMADRMAVKLARDREIAAAKRADEAAERASKLESRVRALTEELDARTGYRRVVGESTQWRRVLTQATQVASTETTVLLLGESGTGKEVVARFLHRASPRANGPFIALNCAALPEQLLEAELFGYERGAYTGATQSKPGQLEQAAGGMLFLDEVGEMSMSAQAKFLRVLQEREFQRLGGTRVLRTDARIVAATNRDLARAIANGQFREDLYYRLNVFAIQLPALRDRRDDIMPLSEAFLAEIGRGLGRPPAGISRDARQRLTDYAWPGNVRELRNILERAAILSEGGLITAEHLAVNLSIPAAASAAVATAASVAVAVPVRPSSAGDLQSMERGMIEEALQTARFNKSKAAKALGLTRQQLYVRMRKYGLE